MVKKTTPAPLSTPGTRSSDHASNDEVDMLAAAELAGSPRYDIDNEDEDDGFDFEYDDPSPANGTRRREATDPADETDPSATVVPKPAVKRSRTAKVATAPTRSSARHQSKAPAAIPPAQMSATGSRLGKLPAAPINATASSSSTALPATAPAPAGRPTTVFGAHPFPPFISNPPPLSLSRPPRPIVSGPGRPAPSSGPAAAAANTGPVTASTQHAPPAQRAAPAVQAAPPAASITLTTEQLTLLVNKACSDTLSRWQAAQVPVAVPGAGKSLVPLTPSAAHYRECLPCYHLPTALPRSLSAALPRPCLPHYRFVTCRITALPLHYRTPYRITALTTALPRMIPHYRAGYRA
ncbi:hypothetical protein PLICRDRAFT_176859 [Plicaturopsis crispa FD-325 SS-3]|nr:hypothetical protein PLICRDRAFT_176859 [Plicaturopsis crispa FD-325 SS-3]